MRVRAGFDQVLEHDGQDGASRSQRRATVAGETLKKAAATSWAGFLRARPASGTREVAGAKMPGHTPGKLGHLVLGQPCNGLDARGLSSILFKVRVDLKAGAVPMSRV